LTYLSFDEFEEGPVDARYTWEKLETRLQKGQFLAYAATNWSEHTTQINQEMNALRTTFSRLAASSPKMNLAHQIFNFFRYEPFRSIDFRNGTSLQSVVRLGLVTFVKDILGSGADVNAKGGPFDNALYAAVSEGSKGNEAIVRLLVDSGTDVNPKALSAVEQKRCLLRELVPAI
jgi:hypothetical protein